jgi:hypothetical protein
VVPGTLTRVSFWWGLLEGSEGLNVTAHSRHPAATRNLFNRLIGKLYYCLQRGKAFDEAKAFPAFGGGVFPHDCVDGLGGAYWRRPHAYLATVQAGMSLLFMTPKPALREGLSRLRAGLASGEWNRQHQDLLDSPLGYRGLIAELP